MENIQAPINPRTKTINISLPEELLIEADKLAKDEYRTRSELLREALRRYILRKQLDSAYAYGERKAKESGVTPETLNEEIAKVRSRARVK